MNARVFFAYTHAQRETKKDRDEMKKVKKNMIKYCFYLLLKNKSTITIHLQHTLYVRIDAVQSHCSWKETDRDSGINNVENVKRPRAVE